MTAKHLNGRANVTRPGARPASLGVRPGSAARPQTGPRERLNLRFFAWLLGGFLVFGAAWYGLHRWQVQRHAAQLLGQADQAEAQGRPGRAARFVGLYVGLVPGDTEARIRYGQLLDRLADTPGAREGVVAVFEQVLLADPGRHDIRRRVATLAIDLGRFDDAVQHLGALPDDVRNDGEVRELFGRAHEGRGEYVQATKAYQAAITAAPARVESYLRMARLYRDRLGRRGEADKVMANLVKANAKSFRAYLGRAKFLQDGAATAKALKDAQGDMEKALQLAPDEAEVLLAAADLAAKLPDGRTEARKHLQRLLKRYPEEARGYEALARVELADGKPREAIAAFRRGLTKLPDHDSLLWNLANLLIQQGTLEEANELISRLDKLDVPRPRRDYLRAALQLRRGDPAGARKSLEGVRPLVTDSRELTIQCDLLLAECSERLGEPETEALICRRTITLGPRQPLPRLRLASALLRLGRVEDALAECQALMTLPAAPPSGWLLLARLMIRQELRRAPAQQQWGEVEKILVKAAKADDSGEADLLRAEVCLARKDVTGAQEVLRQAREKHPARGELWVASVALAIRGGKPDAAADILRQAEQKLGDGAALRLARLRVLLGSKGGDSAKALSAFEASLDKLAGADRVKVLAALAEAHYEAGRTAEARRLWEQVTRLSPGDFGARLRVFELAVAGDDEASMERALAAIVELEGQGGPFGRYNDARRLIRLAAHKDKNDPNRAEQLAKARAELEEIGKRWPGSPRVPLCLGQIQDLDANPERALEQYLRAVELGERQPELIRRTVQLLYDRGRYTEADFVIQRLPEQTLVLGDMQRLEAEVSYHKGDAGRALRAARRAAQAESKDYRHYVWVGQFLWMASRGADGEPEQQRADEAAAEKALKRAVELAEKAPEGWVALVQHYARTGRSKEAGPLIEQARKKVPADQAAFALAQCYAAVNRPDDARKLFAEVVRARPDDPSVLRTAAGFFLRVNDTETAQRCLEKMTTLGSRDPRGAAWARSVLAMVMATSGDAKKAGKALALLGLTEKGGKAPDTGTDVLRERTKAAVLAILGPGIKEYRQAIGLLEGVHLRQPLAPEDRFLLVQLYERVGNPDKAAECMQPLLKPGASPRYLGHHVNFLLSRRRVAEAQTWLAELEKQEPKSLRTAFLQARLLKAQDKGAEAGALLKGHVEGKNAPTLLGIALLLEEVGCGADAVDVYRKYVTEAKKPEAVFLLARCLARQKRTAEALDLCDGAWDKCSPEATADTLLGVLHESPAAGRPYDRVERRLKEAIDKHREALGLVLCLASLHELRGRYEDAEGLYRQVLAKAPRNAVALNNLAWILALRDGKGDEALAHANRAVEALGPIPELLDTRAVAHLVAGRTALALTDLQAALGRPTLDAKVRFSITIHLAQAYQRAGKLALARQSWQQAQAQGGKVDTLHGLERAGYEKLAHEFARP